MQDAHSLLPVPIRPANCYPCTNCVPSVSECDASAVPW